MTEEHKVGQTFWWVSSNNARTQGEVSIVKVGRVWLTLSNGHRVDKKTMVTYSGEYVSPGSCWPSKEHFEQHLRLSRMWTYFRSAVSNTCTIPKNVTRENIKEAASLINLKLVEA
jgi:hypothetical protein